MRWCLEQGVETMVTPQFSYYEVMQNCMAAWNNARIMRWYSECAELGFPHVALDWPPGNMDWAREAYLEFIARNEVKLIAPSLQTFHDVGGVSIKWLADFQRLHQELPSDVGVLMFGVGVVNAFAQIASIFKGRNLTFVSPRAYVQATQWRLLNDARGPGSKGDCFADNVLGLQRMADAAMEAVNSPEAPARGSRRARRVRPRPRPRRRASASE
jgi:hypothetical protein